MAYTDDDLDDSDDWSDEPRTPEEIAEAQEEFFERLWYHRKLVKEQKLRDAGDLDGLGELERLAGAKKRQLEEKYAGTGKLGPYTDWELGVLCGKLSATRWALGDDWDNFDT